MTIHHWNRQKKNTTLEEDSSSDASDMLLACSVCSVDNALCDRAGMTANSRLIWDSHI